MTDTTLHDVAPASFRDGVKEILPVAFSVIPYTLLIGALAAQKGISPLEMLIMSAGTFAGGAQFVAVGLWDTSVPVIAIAFAVFVVNSRHILMGAAIAPAIQHLPLRIKLLMAHVMVDETWAIALTRYRRGGFTPAYYAGLALPLFLLWPCLTTLGVVIGDLVPDPERYGIDFAFAGIFLFLLQAMIPSKADLRPVGGPILAAGITAVLVAPFVGSALSILIGALAGVAAGALLYRAGERR